MKDADIVGYYQRENYNEINRIYSIDPPVKLWTIFDEDHSSLINICAYLGNVKMMTNLIDFLSLNLSKENLRSLVDLKNRQGLTPIHSASFKGNVDMIKLLIKNGADINNVNSTGVNVMHFAAQGNQPNSLTYFKEEHNMSIEGIDNKNNTPLHWACYSGALESVSYLLHWGAQINQTDINGHTALHLAAMSRHQKIIKKLIQNGIDMKIKDNKGMTARQLAESKQMDLIAKMLKEREKCSLCLFRTPINKSQGKRMNIVTVFILEVFVSVCFLLVLFPSNNNLQKIIRLMDEV